MKLAVLISATLLFASFRLFLLGKETNDVWFFIASGALSLGSIGSTARILLTYKGHQRQ